MQYFMLSIQNPAWADKTKLVSAVAEKDTNNAMPELEKIVCRQQGR
jgi:hypothetical protein